MNKKYEKKSRRSLISLEAILDRSLSVAEKYSLFGLIITAALSTLTSCGSDTTYDCTTEGCVEVGSDGEFLSLEDCQNDCHFWFCDNGNCNLNLLADGDYVTLEECQNSCGNNTSGYDCVNGNCESVSSGGSYATLAECETDCSDIVTGSFSDPRDGTVYRTVTIGTQTWMVENLKYLPSVVGPGSTSETMPRHYVYDYYGTSVSAAKATNNYLTYGVLYNWHAAMAGSSSSNENPSGVQGACPSGWHLPSLSEWEQLEAFLVEDAGGKLKETGTSHWNSPNFGATNETGFTALPGGFSNFSDTFFYQGQVGYWWSSTEDDVSYTARFIDMTNTGDGEICCERENKAYAFSCRCIKD